LAKELMQDGLAARFLIDAPIHEMKGFYKLIKNCLHFKREQEVEALKTHKL